MRLEFLLNATKPWQGIHTNTYRTLCFAPGFVHEHSARECGVHRAQCDLLYFNGAQTPVSRCGSLCQCLVGEVHAVLIMADKLVEIRQGILHFVGSV